MTELVASIGFVGVAIDLFHRTGARDRPPSKDQMLADVSGTMQWASQQEFARKGKVALWGFGYGAGVALRAASLPGLSSAICFCPNNLLQAQGNDPPVINDVEGIKAPVLLCVPDQDYHLLRGEIEELTSVLNAAGKSAFLQVYPGVGYSFFYQTLQAMPALQADSDQALAEANADAWGLVSACLIRNFANDSVD
jgi:carboxymethylenebutenolidase